MSDYTWRPIEDLTRDWGKLVSDELSSLAPIWIEQKSRLQDTEALKRFNGQMQRQWAIETGIIEGLYTIESGVTQTLIEHGIRASLIPHGSINKPIGTILPIIKDQEFVIEGLFDFVSQRRPLSTSYIKEVHQALTQHQDTTDGIDQFGNRIQIPLIRGDWKSQPNNPTTVVGALHEYCPPEHVAAEMDNLIDLHSRHSQEGVTPEVEAAWLHHRFTQIHPFQDGNGRVARALATLVFLKAEWFPLVVVSDEHRDEYIRALQDADRGDLSGLVVLFARLQRQAFVRALSISSDVISDQESLKAVIFSVADRLRIRSEKDLSEKREVFGISSALEEKTDATLRSVGEDIRQQLIGIDNAYQIDVRRSDPANEHWFWNQVLETAKQFSYFADLRTYHAWVRLSIRKVGERQTELVFSFHSLGTEFVGIVSSSAFIEHRVLGEDGAPTLDGPYAACHETFQFSYNQDVQAVLGRFEKWLNSSLVTGIDQWRRQL